MQVGLEIAYRNVDKSDAIEDLIRTKLAKLQKLHNHIISCHISIERPQKSKQSGNPYRVRITTRIPSGHEVVVTRNPKDYDLHDPLDMIVRDAFDVTERQLRRNVKRQQHDVKVHPRQEASALVAELNEPEGYGFLETVDGRRIYFHQHSVLHDDFKRLKVGDGVNFVEEMGDQGPQASSVHLVDKPGVRLNGEENTK
jgi:ribosomal subunit interface protein